MHSQEALDVEIERLRERLESAEEMRRALVAEEIDGFVVGGDADRQRVVLLETSKLSSAALLERLPHCIVTVSHRGDILYANQRLAALVGHPLAQLFGTSVSDLLVPEHRSAFQKFIEAGVLDAGLDVNLATCRRALSLFTSDSGRRRKWIHIVAGQRDRLSSGARRRRARAAGDPSRRDRRRRRRRRADHAPR